MSLSSGDTGTVFQQFTITGPIAAGNFDFDCTDLSTLRIQIDTMAAADTIQIFGSVDGVTFGPAFAPNTLMFDELLWEPVQAIGPNVNNGSLYVMNIGGFKTLRFTATKAGATTTILSVRGGNSGPGMIGVAGLVIAQQAATFD